MSSRILFCSGLLLSCILLMACSKAKDPNKLFNDKGACLGFIGQPLSCEYESNIGNSGLSHTSMETLIQSADIEEKDNNRIQVIVNARIKNIGNGPVGIISGNKILMDSSGKRYQPVNPGKTRALNPGDSDDFQWIFSLPKELLLNPLYFSTFLNEDKLHPEKGFKIVQKLQIKLKSDSIPISGTKTSLKW